MIAEVLVPAARPWAPPYRHDTVAARGMGIRRGGRWILRPADFGMASGVIGLAGPPGTGKSTVLATLATLRRHSAGHLEILGHDTAQSGGLREARARLGYLPDDFDWATGLTVGEFVAYAGYFKRTPGEAIPPLLRRFDLADAAGVTIGRLATDLRLRAGLAATCVHQPELVLLDEPLAGLSDDQRDELIPVIRSAAPAVVVTAESAESLLGWCDRVFTLARGRLIESPTRMLAREGYPEAGPRPGDGVLRERIGPDLLLSGNPSFG